MSDMVFNPPLRNAPWSKPMQPSLAVMLPPGYHKLHVRYWPRRMTVGIWMTAIGTVGVLGFFIGGWLMRRLRLNFRNHRKLVVVDGRKAWVGGHNVADEYLGKNPQLSSVALVKSYKVVDPTHIKLMLSSDQAIQVLYSFAGNRDGMVMEPASFATADQHPVGAGPFMTIGAVERKGGRHESHGLHEIVHRNPLERPDVLEDLFGRLALAARDLRANKSQQTVPLGGQAVPRGHGGRRGNAAPSTAD
jgi:hypothetical protein